MIGPTSTWLKKRLYCQSCTNSYSGAKGNEMPPEWKMKLIWEYRAWNVPGNWNQYSHAVRYKVFPVDLGPYNRISLIGVNAAYTSNHSTYATPGTLSQELDWLKLAAEMSEHHLALHDHDMTWYDPGKKRNHS